VGRTHVSFFISTTDANVLQDHKKNLTMRPVFKFVRKKHVVFSPDEYPKG